MIWTSDMWEFLPSVNLKRLAFLLLSSVFLLLGFLDFFTNHGPNKCEMTYMFEKPEYIEVSLNESIRKSFPHYGLFIYGEGRYARELEAGKLDGLPVIFIPGNAGSYRQVRSLASVSLRKQYDKGSKFGFNFFTVDFDEEFSAFYGKLLYDQTRYLHHVVKTVLGLYGGRRKDVVLIGHSMGGIVARALFGLPDFDRKSVKVLITLATPHSAPVAVPDALVSDFYQEVESVWGEGSANGNLSHVSVVSITGGFRDVQVWSGLGKPRGIPDEALITAVSTAVPDVWVGTDHLCIVWCKQLVLATSRALFDLIDAGSRSMTTDVELTRKILDYHFRHRSAGKSFWSSSHPPVVTLDKEAYWWEVNHYSWTFKPEDLPKKTYIAIPLKKDSKYEAMSVLVAHHQEKDWIFACRMVESYKKSRVCSEGINLSRQASIVPGTVKRKFVDLDLVELRLKNFTHVVILHPGPQSSAVAVGEVHSNESRMVRSSPSYLASYLQPIHLVRRTDPGALSYRLIFKKAFSNPSKAYSLMVETLSCKDASSRKISGWVEFGVPDNEDSVYEPLRSQPGTIEKFKTKLQTTIVSSGAHPEARLVLDPACVYSVKLSASFEETLGQMWRLYCTQIPAYIAVVMLTGFLGQVEALAKEGKCPSFPTACCSIKGLLLIVLPYRVISYLLMSPGIMEFVPETDANVLERSNLDFFVLPLVLYCAAVPLVYCMSVVAWVLVIACGSGLHQLTLRVFSKVTKIKDPIAEIAVEGLSKLPGIVVVVLLAVGHATCGGFALALGVTYYFIKVFQYYEEFVESLVAKGVGMAVRTVRRRLAGGSDEPQEGADDGTSVDDGAAGGGETLEKTPASAKKEASTSDQDSAAGNDESTSVAPADEAAQSQAEEDEEESLTSLINVKARFHLGVLMLWVCALVVNASSLLSWMTRLNYAMRLDPDPSALTGFLVLASAVVVWQGSVPHLRRSDYFIRPLFLRVLGIAMLLYGSVSSYRLGPMLGLSLVWLALHERFSKRAASV